jgi:hypothetical protein
MYLSAFALGLITAMGWMSGVSLFKKIEDTTLSAPSDHKYKHETATNSTGTTEPGSLRGSVPLPLPESR